MMFSLSPRVRETFIPIRSTAAQSSVRVSPSATAFSRAARIRDASKTWGVWTAHRLEPAPPPR